MDGKSKKHFACQPLCNVMPCQTDSQIPYELLSKRAADLPFAALTRAQAGEMVHG